MSSGSVIDYSPTAISTSEWFSLTQCTKLIIDIWAIFSSVLVTVEIYWLAMKTAVFSETTILNYMHVKYIRSCRIKNINESFSVAVDSFQFKPVWLELWIIWAVPGLLGFSTTLNHSAITIFILFSIHIRKLVPFLPFVTVWLVNLLRRGISDVLLSHHVCTSFKNIYISPLHS